MLKSIDRIEKALLGQILLRKGLILEAELEQALREQINSKKKLGEILIEQNLISSSELDRVLNEQNMMLGKILRNEVEEVESIIPRCNFEGMCTMNQSIYRLYEEGRITEETALEASPKPNEMAQILRGRA